MEISIMEILAARDNRAATQKRLLDHFGKPLVCFTMNIAGPVKYSDAIQKAYDLGKRLLLARISPLHFEEVIRSTGCEGFFVVDSPAEELKRICVMIEDSQPVCRLFDMDVLDTDSRKLSREELGLTDRKCLICNESAHVCSRSRAHGLEQLQAKTAALLQFDSQGAFIGSLAYQALIQEVCTTPKPGLVDLNNSGSHQDMDVGTFYQSALALREYFYSAALCEDFDTLRKLGTEAEKAMFQATGGVNTHKGAIFTLGILCACATGNIWDNCRRFCKGLVQRDLSHVTEASAKTAGERLYAKYGITGIRGQAEKGFPAVSQVGLPVLQQGLARGLRLNDAGCATLLHILQATEDTNMIHRSNVQTAKKAATQVAAILDGNPYPDADILQQLDADFITKNLSPGGSADLLAATYFVHFLTCS